MFEYDPFSNEFESFITHLTTLLKRPNLNVPTRDSIKRSGLSQVLRASVYENQGNLECFEKFSVKQAGLSQFQILEASNDQRVHT